MSANPGQTLSHYRLIEKIGEGGMGVVWKAEDTVLGRTVAIKVLPADVARDEKRRQMFLGEARLASSLSEAHIAQVYEFDREGDLDFIVMEYVDGKPLSKILHGRPLPPERVAAIGVQAAHALSRAHRKSLLHRDLKPSNIMVTPDSDVKIVDFGLATLFAPMEMSATEATTRSLHADALPGRNASANHGPAGTLPYMSRRQACVALISVGNAHCGNSHRRARVDEADQSPSNGRTCGFRATGTKRHSGGRFGRSWTGNRHFSGSFSGLESRSSNPLQANDSSPSL